MLLSVRTPKMVPKDFTVCCACFFLCILKIQGSSLKCCFKVLENDSVSYQLSDPPGPSCTTTWSANGMVVVDENGEMDQNTVAYHEPQKLILNEKMAKQVTYRQDCTSSGNSYKGTCNDSCAIADVTVKATPEPPQMKHIIIPICIIISVIIFIIIIITIIIRCRNHSSPSNVNCRVLWKAVPKEATSPLHQV